MPASTTAIAWHVTARLRRNRVITSRDGDPKRLARLVLGKAQRARRDPQIMAFSVPDTHLHLLLGCDRQVAGIFVNHLLGGLVRDLELDNGFDRAWFGPVQTQRHLRSALSYVLRQHQRHETRHDPFREASNLPDLLGLRPLGAFTLSAIHRELPRLEPSGFAPFLGAIRTGSHGKWLREAAAAASTVAVPDLDGRSRETVDARRAAVHWGQEQGLSIDWLASHLSLCPRSVQRLLLKPPDPALTRAIGLQIGLREAHAGVSPLAA